MTSIVKRIEWSVVAAMILAGAMIFGAVAFAQDESAFPSPSGSAVSGVTYPIPELGNCGTKAECKSYCDQAANLTSCIAFAKSHGLMNKEEADRAEKFATKVQSGEAPGGCNSPGSCREFCEDLNNIDACVAFAEKNEFKGEQYEQGKKMSEFLKSGGQTPGGCTNRASCEAYCGDFSHAEECFAFAQKAGITQTRGAAGSGPGRGPSGGEDFDEMPTPEQFRKLAELTKNGETPGGCTSKKECMSYCEIEANMDECITFGEKAGFMSQEEAQKAKQFKQMGGPGGCKSRQECESYCNDPANRETCFRFAEENGFISKEEVARAKEGMVRMRQGFEEAPPEVRECLNASLGTNIIEDIQSGKLTPGPEIGERMRGCFEKHGQRHNPREVFEHAPPEVLACLKEKTGDQFAAIEAGTAEPTPEMADAFRLCFQQKQFEEGWNMPEGEIGEMGGSPMGEGGSRGMGNPGMGQGGMGGEGYRKPPPIGDFLRTAPPEVASCVKEQLGADAAKVESGEFMPGPEFGQKMRSCFEQFRPQDPMQMGAPHDAGQGAYGRPNGGEMGGMGDGMMPMPPHEGERREGTEGAQGNYPLERTMGWITNLPPPVLECMKMKFGAEALKKIATAGPTKEVEELITACQTQYAEKQMGGSLQDGMQRGMMPSSGGVSGTTMRPPETTQPYGGVTDGKYMPPPQGEMTGGFHPSGEGTYQYQEGMMMPPQGTVTGGTYPQPSGSYPPPPEGGTGGEYYPPPPGGTGGTYYAPPPSGTGDTYTPPPEGGTQPPPPPPSDGTQSSSLTQLLLGAVFAPFTSLWNILN